ncbi:antibiotic biosynthesis monooxygenase [Streptomyces sp. NPDC052682]|uniref:antibiotic biosynthesis monooxygenase family protein n=1 Tax=Streptomyces sp. NPDC052682 TaxID=3154954 RepID=UPI003445DA71
MSDHRPAPAGPLAATRPGPLAATRPGPLAPARPVAAHEPPYYAVVFTSVRTDDDSGYGETAERMEERVREIPGFLGLDHARSPGGLSITVGYFRDAAAIEEWRGDAEHRTAQQRGRAQWYERYTVHVARVERSHGYERDQD